MSSRSQGGVSLCLRKHYIWELSPEQFMQCDRLKKLRRLIVFKHVFNDVKRTVQHKKQDLPPGLRFSSENENFKRAAHQSTFICGEF